MFNKKEYAKKYRERNKEYYKEYAKKYNKKYYWKNKAKEKIRKQNWKVKNPNYHKEYYRKNKEKILGRMKKHYSKNKEYYKQYWKKNNKKKKEYKKKYYLLNKDKIKEKNEQNKDTISKRHKKYYKNNKDKINITRRLYLHKKVKESKKFSICIKLRRRFIKALNKYLKTGKIMASKEYGIDYKAIIKYLKPFPEDLKNYEIHHIKPLFRFNFINEDGSTNLEEIKKAFAPENHQLMLKSEHRKLNHRNL